MFSTLRSVILNMASFSPVPIAIVFAAFLSVPGCTSTITSNTARTAKEQLLLSDAVERSISKVDLSALAGQKIFVEEKFLECVDKPFIVGSIRHQVMRSGARLADTAEMADVVMELRSGGVGTDTSESYLGTPEIALPGMLTLPEIRLAERKMQLGFAKLGMVLYDAKTRELLGDGGVTSAQSDDNNWYVFGAGPFQNGSLRENVKIARRDVPGMHRRRIPPVVVLGTRPKAAEEPDVPDVRFAAGATGK